MFKNTVVILSFISCFSWSLGFESLYFSEEVKKIGAIYDLIEDTDKNRIIISAEEGVYSYTGKSLTQLLAKSYLVFYKLIYSGNNIYALSFTNEIHTIKGDSLVLSIKIDSKEIVNNFKISKDKVYISTPNKVIIRSLNSSNETKIVSDSYLLGLYANSDSIYSVSHSNNKIQISNLINESRFSIDFAYRVVKFFSVKNTFFLLSNDKLYVFDVFKKTLNEITALPLALNNVKCFEMDYLNHNQVLIGHNKGFSIFSIINNNWEHYFQGYSVYSMLKDKEENLWLGCKYQGLIRVPSLQILQNNLTEVLDEKDRIVSTYTVDSKLYIGTNLGNIIILDLQSNYTFKIPLNNSGEVQTIYEYNDTLYAYCDKLYRIDSKRKKIITTSPLHSTRDIYVDQDGIYCATTGDFQNVRTGEKYNQGYWHNCIYVDSLDDNIFVGNKSGLTVLSKKNDVALYNLESARKEGIIKILSQFGNIRLYGNLGGVYDKYLRYLNGFDVVGLKDVIFTQNKQQFIYSKHKVYYIENNKKQPFTVVNTILGGHEIVDIRALNNSLIITTTENIIKLKNYPELLGLSSTQDVQLEVENNINKRKTNQLSLKYQNNGVKFFVKPNRELSYFDFFEYTYVINQNSPEKLIRNKNGNLELDLKFLPEGETSITFFVTNETGAIIKQNTFAIHVQSPFWKSFIFYLLICSLVMLLILTLHRRKLIKIKRDNLISIQKERSKTHLVKSQLATIRSQMNSHFIYNTLSTIQLKIAKKDTQIAFKMVQKFSSLLRGVLNYSQVEFITLREELDVIENYLSLEKERFNHDISISIEVSNKLDLDYFKIPSLISQPFIENSLLHGLRHRESDRRLTIKIFKVDTASFCLNIVDNGIGIEKANQINSENKLKSSFALDAIKKRVDFINALGGLSIVLDVNSSALGTNVKIVVSDYD